MILEVPCNLKYSVNSFHVLQLGFFCLFLFMMWFCYVRVWVFLVLFFGVGFGIWVFLGEWDWLDFFVCLFQLEGTYNDYLVLDRPKVKAYY